MSPRIPNLRMKGNRMQDKLLILNYDHRFAAAVAIKLRAERIACRVIPGDTPFEQVMAEDARGLVLAGGISGELPGLLDGRLMSSGLPVLALGDAAAAMALLLGGKTLEHRPLREAVKVRFSPSTVTQGLSQSERYLDSLTALELSGELTPIAYAQEQVIGFAHSALPLFGLGFQPESNDPDGVSILLQFAKDVCGCTMWYSENDFIHAARNSLEQELARGTALCEVTGSLESGVTAALAHRALGDRLTCFLIDNCLLRESEKEDILYYYRDTLGISLQVIDAQDRFCQALSGLVKSREKAEAIAAVRSKVLEELAAMIPHDAVILSTTAGAMTGAEGKAMPQIESGKPRIEPLIELFAGEIRYVGEALNLPGDICLAQPFPQTGLALRVEGEVTRRRLAILRKADGIFREEIREANLQKRLHKFFASLSPVHGAPDELTVTLRAVTLTSVRGEQRPVPARLPYDLTESCTARLMQALPEVSRVVNDITPGRGLIE